MVMHVHLAVPDVLDVAHVLLVVEIHVADVLVVQYHVETDVLDVAQIVKAFVKTHVLVHVQQHAMEIVQEHVMVL